MEEDQEENFAVVTYHRSPIFRKDEVKYLLDQIVKNKEILLNKSTNSTSNQAKDRVWAKICKEMNQQGFEHKRTPDVLKTKWLNLKRTAKRVTRNIIDINCPDINDLLAQVVMLLNENESNTSVTEDPEEDKYPLKSEAINGTVTENDNETSNQWEGNVESEESNDADERRRSRTSNFTPSECSLLLRCVRDEKDNVLIKGKGSSVRAVKIANEAWHRITIRYNRQSTLKRSTKMLRTKFSNMKKLANFKRFVARNMRRKRLINNVSVEIKQEPVVELSNMDMDNENDHDHDNDNDNDNDNDVNNDDFPELPVIMPDVNLQNEDNSDPLCMVLNGDSGIESISHSGSYSPFENKEVVKLKLDLLKYQLETARLERQRIQESLEAESSERRSRAIETSLRLRAARLEAVATEARLPSTHPALRYTEEEKLAAQYLGQFEHTIVSKSENYLD